MREAGYRGRAGPGSGHGLMLFVGVVTDTTAGQHDATRLEIRGNVGLIDQREEVAVS